MKDTKRKGFNFYRSYFDVYNELNDKDKIAFIDALLNRQFLGTKPDKLKGMAKFAYISQMNSIDQQVKGYEDKTGLKLSSERVENTPTEGGSQGGALGEFNTPRQQEKEKEKGKEYTPLEAVTQNENDIDFLNFCKFIDKLDFVKTIPNQINFSQFQSLKQNYSKQLIGDKLEDLNKWLEDPNIPKAKKKKKSLYHLMVNTWLKNNY